MSHAEDNLKLTPLIRWWLPERPDHVTTAAEEESPGGSGEGQLFYVPADPIEGTHSLYRLYQTAADDHMDSILEDEGGYALDQLLGYPFDTQEPGTEPIRRWFHPLTGDHLLAFPDEDPTHDGYVAENILGYGYPRFRNQGEIPIVVRGSEVTLAANRVAGGTICELWWNEKQFVNNWDYGRQIQIAFNLGEVGETNNPTEAGDRHGWPGAVATAAEAHGSPLLDWEVADGRLTTTCHPLQYGPDAWDGGPHHPVLWRGTIAKEIDLDWEGNPHVIRWKTVVTFPHDEPRLDLEIVTAYLTTEFEQFSVFDLATGVPIDISMELGPDETERVVDPNDDDQLQKPDLGVMLATPEGDYALAIYRRTPRTPEDRTNPCGVGRFKAAGENQAVDVKYRLSGAKWSLLYRSPPWGISAGPLEFVVYLLVGTREQVLAEAQRLYADGV